MAERTVRLDLGVDDVHVPSATPQPAGRAMTISAAKRRSLPGDKFAVPGKRAYPIDTAARTRNAAARLEQNKSSLSSSEYAEAKRRIAAASKRFGIKSEYSKPARAASRGLRMRINTDGSIHVRHNSDIVGGKTVFCEQFELDSKTIELADGKPKAVWIQVAKPGEFKGHPAGPFKLDATTFNDIVRNFRATQNRRIAIDFEHASEQKPTDGGIPVLGAPAQGWMTDFDIRPDGLYSLVEWLPLAADYIKTGQYKYFSPAIRFDAVDRVTGKNIGARMTSGALTNKPFLDGMKPLVARDFDAQPETPEELAAVSLGDAGYATSPNEFLPRFRRALSMDELASPPDMLARVCRLMELCELADGDASATVQGIQLGNHIAPLREMMRMPMNTSLGDMLEAVAEMIESCCADDDDESGASMTASEQEPAAVQPPSQAGTAPAKKEPIMETITLSEHETKVKLAVSEAVTDAVAKAVAPLNLQLNDAQTKLTKTESDKAVLEEQVRTLSEQVKAQAKQAIADRVEEAFLTYKDSHKLTDLHKKQMTLTLTSDPETFNALYPRVTPDKQPLLRVISKDGAALPASPQAKPVPSLTKLCADIQKKSPHLTYDDAFTMALEEQAKLLAG
jgi:phage I-like protein